MQHRKRIGLALGAGALRGFAHLGVLKVLSDAEIPIDFVVGTSVGSLVGAAFCAGMPVDQIIEISREVTWPKLARINWGSIDGLVTFRGIRTLLDDLLDQPTFESLKIPFSVVTTDVDGDCEVAVSEGLLAPAVEASCSVSGIVAPVEWNGLRLADGVFVNSLPVSVARSMGAEYVIGVDVLRPMIRPNWGAISQIVNAFEIVFRHAGGGTKMADCLISPEIGGFTYIRFSKRGDLIARGAEATTAMLPQIRRDILGDA